jgi:hypothetical protein
VAYGLEKIDWSAPWLAPLESLGRGIAADVEVRRDCAQALNARAAAPVTFVPQSELPAGVAYEQYIYDHHRVPTRNGLHDFFNGLLWLRMPRTKLRLNHLQAQQIARTGIQPVRGPARDALTLFDENVALFHGPDDVWDALQRKDWETLMLDRRPRWSEVHITLFGHALMEQLVAPRKGITAHVFRVHSASAGLADTDQWLSEHLSAAVLAAKPFAHLPVLGVPGWWPANAMAQFYADKAVFRPLRNAVQMEGK